MKHTAPRRRVWPNNDSHTPRTTPTAHQLDKCTQHSDYSNNKCDPTQHEDKECSTAQREEECGPQYHNNNNEDSRSETPQQRRGKRRVRPKPTDKEVEGERSPTQRTSPMLTLRDPTTIEVSPSTRMAGEVEGVEGKGVEMGGKDATHTKVEEGRSHALRFRLFFLILHVPRHNSEEGQPSWKFH